MGAVIFGASPDLSGYMTLGTVQTVTGAKTFEAGVVISPPSSSVGLLVSVDGSAEPEYPLQVYDYTNLYNLLTVDYEGSLVAAYGVQALQVVLETTGAKLLTIMPETLSADRTARFPNLTGTVCLTSGAQTLVNKTLTTPIITTPSVTASETLVCLLGYNNIDAHDTSAPQTIFTTPAEVKARVVYLVARDAAASLAGCTDVDFTNWRQGVSLASMTTGDGTDYMIINAADGEKYTEIPASTAFQATVNAAATADPAIVRIDVFGYLTGS